MGNLLTETEIGQVNAAIDQCERLITSRGRFTPSLGLYQGEGFEVIFKRDSTKTGVQVRRYGAVVLRIQWEHGRADPGRVVWEPGAWFGELMALRAAHA